MLPASCQGQGGLHSRFTEDKSLLKRVRVTKAIDCREGQIVLNDIYNIITVQAQSILRQIFPQLLPLRYRKSARIQPHPQFQQGIPLRPH